MIKLGIIGTHWIAKQFVEAVKLTGKYDVTCVYSRKEETARRFINDCKLEAEIFTGLSDFFEQGDFDTVYIASPNSLHFVQAELAINNGKNVIVEKPAFANPMQLNEIFSLLAHNKNVHLFEAARNIHTPNFIKIKQQVQKMENIEGAEFTYSKYSSRYDLVKNGEEPNVFSLKFAGGALQDLGVYVVYDSIALFGSPNEVEFFPKIISTGVDGKGTAILRYSDIDVVLNFSKITNSHMNSEIYGSKDLISIDDAGEILNVTYTDEEGKTESLGVDDLPNPMIPEAADFAEVIESPDLLDNKRKYGEWLTLMTKVNETLFEMRKKAGIKFLLDLGE